MGTPQQLGLLTERERERIWGLKALGTPWEVVMLTGKGRGLVVELRALETPLVREMEGRRGVERVMVEGLGCLLPLLMPL